MQDAVTAQMRSLEEKLAEYRVTHKADEERMEDEITTLEDTLVTVKDSLEKRKRALEADIEADAVASGGGAASLSTSLPAAASMMQHAPSAPAMTPAVSDRTSTGSACSNGSSTSASGVYPTLPVAAARSNTALNKDPIRYVL